MLVGTIGAADEERRHIQIIWTLFDGDPNDDYNVIVFGIASQHL